MRSISQEHSFRKIIIIILGTAIVLVVSVAAGVFVRSKFFASEPKKVTPVTKGSVDMAGQAALLDELRDAMAIEADRGDIPTQERELDRIEKNVKRGAMSESLP